MYLPMPFGNASKLGHHGTVENGCETAINVSVVGTFGKPTDASLPTTCNLDIVGVVRAKRPLAYNTRMLRL